MATQIDARVKQKTGTAADFAGYVLLEGEIALVRTSASGPVWNFKVGPGNFDSLDWSLQNPGAAQEADTSTVFPAGVPGLYIPTESGDYGPDDVEVDLTAGYTQLIWDGTTLTDVVFPIDLSGYAAKNEVLLRDQFVQALTPNTNLFNKAADFIPEKLWNSSGVLQDFTGLGCTDKIYIGEGTRVWVAKGWSGAPSSYVWFDENEDFIAYGSGIPDSPGGEVPSRPVSARYIGINLAASPGEAQTNADTLMVYVGTDIQAYKDYVINPDVSEQIANDTYLKPEFVSGSGINLNAFDKASIVDGRAINSSGVSIVAAGAGHSDYMEIVPNVEVWVRKITGSPSSGAWYDESKVFISSISMPSGDGLVGLAPAGAKYARVNVYNVSTPDVQANIDAFMFYSGNELIPYAPYARELKSIAGLVIPSQQEQNVILQEYNLGGMPNLRYKLSQLLSSEPVLLNIGFLGDSWTQSVPGAINYVRDISKLLRSEYGNGGGGFYDFSVSSGNQFMRSADIDDATDSRSGTIEYKDQTADSKGINIAHAEFNTGSSLTLNVLTAHTGLEIHYYGGVSYGSFRYRIDAGAWTDVNTSLLNGHQTIPNAVSDSAHTVEFEVTSGLCIILGVDLQRNEGVRVNKLGNRGLFASNYPEVDADNWKNAFSSLNLDSCTILIGTNDRTVNRTPGQFKGDVEYVVNMIRSTVEYTDIALISPSNNENTETYEMQLYARAMQNVAEDNLIPFLSLIPIFGSTEQIIAKGTFADNVHPTENGGKMIAYYIINKLIK